MKSAAELVDALLRRTASVLAELIAPGSPVALVGFPFIWNAGDPAIWLGEKAALERAGCRIAYQCSWYDYRPDLMASRIGDIPILIHGGGNLGDLWLHQHPFRERVIADFPGNPIIQLPQSTYFGDEANLHRFVEVCRSHPRLTFMLRDRTSLEFAARHFPGRSILAPDMAFSIGPLVSTERAGDDGAPILWLSRTDKESAGASEVPIGPDCHRLDWLEPDDGIYRQQEQYYWAQATKSVAKLDEGDLSEAHFSALGEAYDGMAWAGVRRGLGVLARGRVIVTDRLHGHILGMGLGIPQVLLDNSYHKLRSYYDTWTHESAITHFASDPRQALTIAREIVARGDGAPL